MTWDLEEIAAQAWADVWRFSVMEPRVPHSLTPLHHGTYALGRRPLLPLPREGIGVGGTTPSRTH